jgi:hypothetical protein
MYAHHDWFLKWLTFKHPYYNSLIGHQPTK